MNITNIRIFPFDTSSIGGRMRGMAEITIDNELVIRGVKIIQAKKGGYFISYPACKIKGRFYNIISPKNLRVDRQLRRIIMDGFKAIKKL